VVVGREILTRTNSVSHSSRVQNDSTLFLFTKRCAAGVPAEHLAEARVVIKATFS